MPILNLAFDVLTLAGVAWTLYMFRKQRKYIASLHSDLGRPRVTPELIAVWKKKIKTLEPGSKKYKSYAASLDAAGVQWQ